MIPILHCPGVMMPGQFGPIRRTGFPLSDASARKSFTRIMSLTGMPSVMATTSATPAAAASTIASAAKGGGTKIIDALAPVAATACSTVSKTGMPSWTVPPFPGVTPATTDVPYSRQARAWNEPSRPVSPWTRSFVSLPTQIAITPSRPRGSCRDHLRHLFRGVGEVLGRGDLETRLPQDLLPFVDVRPLEADDDGDLEPHLLHRGHDAVGDDVAAHDAAEDVDEDRADVLVREDDPERVLDLLLVRSAAHVEEVRG